MPLQHGDRLGPYQIRTLLGAGGMGEVYRGRDTRLGRDVALKVISSARARQRGACAGASSWRPARPPPSTIPRSSPSTTSARQRHPRRSRWSGWREERCATARHGPLAGARGWPVARQFADGLAAAHAQACPPRPQAGERVDHPRRPRQDPRLRPGAPTCRAWLTTHSRRGVC